MRKRDESATPGSKVTSNCVGRSYRMRLMEAQVEPLPGVQLHTRSGTTRCGGTCQDLPLPVEPRLPGRCGRRRSVSGPTTVAETMGAHLKARSRSTSTRGLPTIDSPAATADRPLGRRTLIAQGIVKRCMHQQPKLRSFSTDQCLRRLELGPKHPCVAMRHS